jgi:hypothetical protein
MALTREQVIYEQMKAAGETQPFETCFFFPTKGDAALARKWLKTPLPSGRHASGILAQALRLVEERTAVPANYLAMVRGLEARIAHLKETHGEMHQ